MTVRTRALAACIVLASTACAQSPSAPDVDPRGLVARYAAAKNAHDASRVGELFAEDYVEHSGRNASGRAALEQNWKTQFQGIPDLRIEIQDVIVAGDKVVARTAYHGTHTVPFLASLPPTGRAFSFGTIDIWRVKDGRFVEHWDQVDIAGLQRQLASKAP